MEMIISTEPPMISQVYSADLLFTPIYIFRADYLFKIAQWIEKKIASAEFRNFPKTRERLKDRLEHFMEFYEQVKIAEKESEGKTNVKANFPFYRPRIDNRNDQSLFERLEDRRKTSAFDRRHNKI